MPLQAEFGTVLEMSGFWGKGYLLGEELEGRMYATEVWKRAGTVREGHFQNMATLSNNNYCIKRSTYTMCAYTLTSNF